MTTSPEALSPAPSTLADLTEIGPRRLVRTAVRATPVLADGIWFSVVLAFIAGAGRIIAPLAVQYSIDHGLTPDVVGPAVAIGTVALLIAGLSSFALNRRLQRRVEAALAQLRRDGLARVHSMRASVADVVPSADLVARLTSDLDQVTTYIQGGGLSTLVNLAQLVIAAGLLLSASVVLSLPTFAIAALLVVTMLSVQRVIARRFAVVRADLSRMQSAVAESVIGAPVIRSTGTDERTRARLDEAVDRARDSQLRSLAPLHLNTALGEIAISTTTLVVIFGGVWWALLGDPDTPRLTSGQVVGMVFLVTFFVRPLQFAVQSLGEAQNAITGWRRAAELALTPDATHRDGRPLPTGPVGVELRGVSARYGSGPLVLSDVDIRIEPGEHIAVVGRTGSGKSTFAKLLTRRIEPSSGEVLLSGIDLRELAESPRRVVIVPQDPFLFAGTLADNLRLGAPDARKSDLVTAITRLGLTDWYDGLEAGLATEVGLRGDRLSVGERQLVALIRTALADPDLIVLDEATSGVDPATDVAIQSALRELTQGRTTVAIAHRMVTAATADRVLVFDDGLLVQAGTHHTLLDQPGPYAGLITAWNHPTLTPGSSR